MANRKLSNEQKELLEKKVTGFQRTGLTYRQIWDEIGDDFGIASANALKQMVFQVRDKQAPKTNASGPNGSTSRVLCSSWTRLGGEKPSTPAAKRIAGVALEQRILDLEKQIRFLLGLHTRPRGEKRKSEKTDAVLAALTNEGQTYGDLMEATGYTNSSVKNLCHKLVKQGKAVIEIAQGNKREVRLS